MDNHVLPRLNQDFFDVCSSAIAAAAFKRADFEKVASAERQLFLLHKFFIDVYAQENMQPTTETGSDKKIDLSDTISTTTPLADISAPQVVASVVEPNKAENEIPPQNDPSLAPKAATKKVPQIPMPADILEIVQVGVEIAKNPPKVRPVKEIPLSSDPDEARKQFNAPME